MNRVFAALLGVFTVLPIAANAAAPPQAAVAPLTAQDLEPFFDGLVPYALRRGDIAGGVIIVVKDGKPIFSKGYGFANLAKHTPVIPDRTLFRIGSVSKLFTWTAVMQLVQAGKLNLDADVNQYLDFTIPHTFGKPVTLRNLMTHTPGFEETTRDLLVEQADQMEPLGDYLKKHLPAQIFPPGTVIAYSNYGATVAGYIVQRVSGEPFEQYIAKHILEPLEMEHSTFVQPLPPNLAPLMANGYMTASEGKPHWFEFVDTPPAGAGTSSAADMAHFMIAYLNGGRFGGATILDPRTIEEMFTLQIAPAQGVNGFGLGFYQENRNGQIIWGHGGDTIVFHSDLHLLPEQHVGVFMSFNSVGKDGAVEEVRNQLFRSFLDRYYPQTPPHEATVANPQRDAARVAGWYRTSRREESALRLVYALGGVNVTAHPDGTIEVSELKDLAGVPLRWHEVGPLLYRQVDGQAHLKFTADENGRIVSFGSDNDQVEVFQRVGGLKTLGSIKALLVCFIGVIVITLLIRLGAWIARRRLGLRLQLTKNERWIHLAARVGAILFLVTLAGWVMLFSSEEAILSPSIVQKMWLLAALGVLAVLGGIAMIAEAVMRVGRGPGGWLVRAGEIVVGLAAVYGIWFFYAFGLAKFVTKF